MTPSRLRYAGLVVLAIPTAVLLIFLIGESADGTLGGLVHLIQLLPLLAIVAAAWRWPRIAGALLILVGSVLAAGYAMAWRPAVMGLGALAAAEATVFLPPIVAGVLLVLSARPPHDVAHPSR